jgi:hypothetical protein
VLDEDENDADIEMFCSAFTRSGGAWIDGALRLADVEVSPKGELGLRVGRSVLDEDENDADIETSRYTDAGRRR